MRNLTSWSCFAAEIWGWARAHILDEEEVVPESGDAKSLVIDRLFD